MFSSYVIVTIGTCKLAIIIVILKLAIIIVILKVAIIIGHFQTWVKQHFQRIII